MVRPCSDGVRALVYADKGVRLETREHQPLRAPDDIRIRVLTVGLCRTDLQVASGQIAVADGRILGHEFCGVVEEIAPNHTHTFTIDDRVSANPLLRGEGGKLNQLGVELDGVLCTSIVLPSSCLVRVCETLNPRRAAYLEPLCAAMAAMNLGLDPSARGLVAGTGRIALLTARVLAKAGFEDILQSTDSPVDFAIETGADTIANCIDALKPGGTLVLKSRPSTDIQFPLRTVLYKQLVLRGALYGDFELAAQWLRQDLVSIDDLLGESVPLADFQRAFDTANGSEQSKPFIEVSVP